MRAVLDTNVIVRALIRPSGSVGPVLRHLSAGSYTLIYSVALRDELVDVLGRPRIWAKYHLDDAAVATTLEEFAVRGELVVPSREVTICRDPKDNRVLEAALAGSADVIVSGDEDLLVLHPFEGIPIVGPVAFLVLLAEARGGSTRDPGPRP